MSGFSWTHSRQERDPRKRNIAWATPPSSAGRARTDYRSYDPTGYDRYSNAPSQDAYSNLTTLADDYPNSNSLRHEPDVWDSRPPIRPQSATVSSRSERTYLRRNSSGLGRIPETSTEDNYSGPVYRTTFEETYLVPKAPANAQTSPDRPWTAGPRMNTKDFEMYKDIVHKDSSPARHHYNRWQHYY